MATPGTFADLDIINAALTGRMGAGYLADIDSPEARAVVVRANYQLTLEACLTHSAWRFNTRQAALNLLLGTPTNRWAAKWQLPADTIKVLYVHPPIRYQILGKELYCDVTSGPLAIDYQIYVLEGDWPAWFRKYVIAQLVMDICKGVTGEDPSQAMKDDLMRSISDALFLDAQQQPNPEPLPNPFIDCRA